MAIEFGDMYFKSERYLAKGGRITAIYDRVMQNNLIVNAQKTLELNSRRQVELYVEALNQENTVYLLNLTDYCKEVMPGLVYVHKDAVDPECPF